MLSRPSWLDVPPESLVVVDFDPPRPPDDTAWITIELPRNACPSWMSTTHKKRFTFGLVGAREGWLIADVGTNIC